MTALRWLSAACLLAGTAAGPASAGETPAPEGARVYFINLQDGQTVHSPVLIQFGLDGMGVAPAGTQQDGTGHHHLLIDTVLEGEDLDYAIPNDDTHRHFGGGQTQAVIELSPGPHELQLVVGDWGHVPHNPPVMSERITVTVE